MTMVYGLFTQMSFVLQITTANTSTKPYNLPSRDFTLGSLFHPCLLRNLYARTVGLAFEISSHDRVLCDKTKEPTADIPTPHEIALVFLPQQRLVRWPKLTH